MSFIERVSFNSECPLSEVTLIVITVQLESFKAKGMPSNPPKSNLQAGMVACPLICTYTVQEKNMSHENPIL